MKIEPTYLHPEGAVRFEGADGKFYWVPTVVVVKLQRHFDEKLAVELFASKAKTAQLRDKWVRAEAELENYRGRAGDEIAQCIANKLRKKTGKFQTMREAVADWIEEGKWKDD